MKKKEAIETIAVHLFSNMVNDIENKLNSTALKNELKYNNKALNETLKNDFKQITEVLQNVVDAFYFNHYEVESFQFMNLQNLKYSLEHNLELVGNAKKLIKFIH